jgi:hypothetical protein
MMAGQDENLDLRQYNIDVLGTLTGYVYSLRRRWDILEAKIDDRFTRAEFTFLAKA